MQRGDRGATLSHYCATKQNVTPRVIYGTATVPTVKHNQFRIVSPAPVILDKRHRILQSLRRGDKARETLMPKPDLRLALKLTFALAIWIGSTSETLYEPLGQRALKSGRQDEVIDGGPFKRIRSELGPFTGDPMKARGAMVDVRSMMHGYYNFDPLSVLPHESAPTIRVSLNETGSIIVRIINVINTASGCTWRGIVQETGESALLMRWTDGHFTGVFGYKGHIYTVTSIAGKLLAMIEDGSQKVPSEHGPFSLKQSADYTPPNNLLATHHNVTNAPRSLPAPDPPVRKFADSERRALEAKQITIDLLILYTNKAASHYILSLPDLIELAIGEVNASFRNSGLENISLRLVRTQLIDYDETEADHFSHLYRMVDGVGQFREVHRLRDETRADIVGMIVDDPSGCGLSTRVAPEPEEAYFVVHHSCAFIAISIGHEVGHILGARHDRQSDANSSPFPFGHGYVNGTKWRDIMSYQESCDGCLRIPFWSNPRISYNGDPTGTAANDNARVLLEQAERVSKFR
jgi:hypothetical protein